jgi:hypothetical protein
MENCYKILKEKKYCTIIMSDFTVEKREVCVQSDVVKLMEKIGFEFVWNNCSFARQQTFISIWIPLFIQN